MSPNILQFNLKQLVFFILIIVNLFFLYFVFYAQISYSLKLVLFLILFIFLLTFITILELVNSLLENLLLWLLFSVFISYILLAGGLLLFFLSFLKVIINYRSFSLSVKLPFITMVHNNFIFVFHILMLFVFIYIYINYDFSQKLPFSFNEFREAFRNFYSFINSFYFNNQAINETNQNFNFLLFNLLNSDNVLENLYFFMNNNLTKNNNILYFFLTISLLAHGIFYTLGFILSLISYFIFFLILKLGIVKIVEQPVGKQFLQF